MKKVILYAVPVLLSALLFSCGITRRMENRRLLRTVPDSLMLVVDQRTAPYTINVNYLLLVPGGYVPPKAQVIYETCLVKGDNRQFVSRVYLNGRTYRRLMWRQEKFDRAAPAGYSDGMMVVAGRRPFAIATNVDVPFREWMPDACLEARTTVTLCGETRSIGKALLARGVIYIPFGPGPVIINESMPVAKEEPALLKTEGPATLTYPVNGYRIDTAYGNNAAELEAMISLFEKILRDTLCSTEKIVVTGIGSPDGPYAYNQDLARNRADQVKSYLVNRLGIAPALIQTGYIAEDWNGLRERVEQSNLANKTAILSIIDGTLGSGSREAALKRLPQYPAIRSQIFPELRRVKCEVYYTEKIWPE